MKKNHSLLPYNTFGVNVNAHQLIELSGKPEELDELKLANASDHPMLILGGGSNVLFTKDFKGTIFLNRYAGIDLIEEDQDHVYLRVGAGENWHSFVRYCIKNNYAGVENLSLIPGNVGASPMQNIGAYGVEVESVIERVNGILLDDGKSFSYTKEECQFGYRTSIFKQALRNKILITEVIFSLNKKPTFYTSYGAIQDELAKMKIDELNIADVSTAVCNIRQSKLPDPEVIGNAGSFFKNPIVQIAEFEILKEQHPEIPNYPAENGKTKLAAGWLIEQCGWKGKRLGNYGVHEKQALVLVNYGGAEGIDILNLAKEIQHSVLDEFGIQLETEVNIY